MLKPTSQNKTTLDLILINRSNSVHCVAVEKISPFVSCYDIPQLWSSTYLNENRQSHSSAHIWEHEILQRRLENNQKGPVPYRLGLLSQSYTLWDRMAILRGHCHLYMHKICSYKIHGHEQKPDSTKRKLPSGTSNELINKTNHLKYCCIQHAQHS